MGHHIVGSYSASWNPPYEVEFHGEGGRGTGRTGHVCWQAKNFEKSKTILPVSAKPNVGEPTSRYSEKAINTIRPKFRRDVASFSDNQASFSALFRMRFLLYAALDASFASAFPKAVPRQALWSARQQAQHVLPWNPRAFVPDKSGKYSAVIPHSLQVRSIRTSVHHYTPIRPVKSPKLGI